MRRRSGRFGVSLLLFFAHLNAGDLGELGAGKRVFLCESKNWFKEMAPSFFGNVFLLRVVYMFRTENGQVLIFFKFSNNG